MKEYYFHNGTSEQGPFSLEEITDKNLKSDTPIWYEGLKNWVPASELEEFSAKFKKKAAPPPLVNIDAPINPDPDKFDYIDKHLGRPKSKNWVKYSLFTLGGLVIIILIIFIGNYFSTKESQIEYLQAKVDTQDIRIQKETEEKAKKEAEKKRINEEITAVNMNFRNNWESYISVGYNEPSVNYALGGISEFSVLVNNRTTYLLDQVDVFIQYIRKNGEIAQERTVTLFNVPAGSVEMGRAPSSLNGVKVRCTISKVISKKMHFCYPSFSGNSEDPYFCK